MEAAGIATCLHKELLPCGVRGAVNDKVTEWQVRVAQAHHTPNEKNAQVAPPALTASIRDP